MKKKNPQKAKPRGREKLNCTWQPAATFPCLFMQCAELKCASDTCYQGGIRKSSGEGRTDEETISFSEQNQSFQSVERRHISVSTFVFCG